MTKTRKLKADDVQKLLDQGYCRVSRRHMILSRIDREDWREHMARDHAPWDWKGDGMSWATRSGMADHYRRCYSKDWIYVDPTSQVQFLKFPGSADGPGQFMGRPRWEKAPVPTLPADPVGTSETQPDQVVGTSESQPDQYRTPHQRLAMQVLITIGIVTIVWGIVEILMRVSV